MNNIFTSHVSVHYSTSITSDMPTPLWLRWCQTIGHAGPSRGTLNCSVNARATCSFNTATTTSTFTRLWNHCYKQMGINIWNIRHKRSRKYWAFWSQKHKPGTWRYMPLWWADPLLLSRPTAHFRWCCYESLLLKLTHKQLLVLTMDCQNCQIIR